MEDRELWERNPELYEQLAAMVPEFDPSPSGVVQGLFLASAAMVVSIVLRAMAWLANIIFEAIPNV